MGKHKSFFVWNPSKCKCPFILQRFAFESHFVMIFCRFFHKKLVLMPCQNDIDQILPDHSRSWDDTNMRLWRWRGHPRITSISVPYKLPNVRKKIVHRKLSAIQPSLTKPLPIALSTPSKHLICLQIFLRLKRWVEEFETSPQSASWVTPMVWLPPPPSTDCRGEKRRMSSSRSAGANAAVAPCGSS